MPKSNYPTSEIVRRYRLGERIERICADAGISRVAVWRRLTKAGEPLVRMPKPVEVVCSQCGKTSRRAKHKTYRYHMFCGQACYMAWVRGKGEAYQPSRQGLRWAWRVVDQYYQLPAGGVIHHHDGDERNNAVSNLAVFASSAEHMSFHRGGVGRPVWDGRDVAPLGSPLEQAAAEFSVRRRVEPLRGSVQRKRFQLNGETVMVLVHPWAERAADDQEPA